MVEVNKGIIENWHNLTLQEVHYGLLYFYLREENPVEANEK